MALNFTEILEEARNKAKLSGAPITRRESSGIAEGYSKTSSARASRAQKLSQEAQKLAQQKEQARREAAWEKKAWEEQLTQDDYMKYQADRAERDEAAGGVGSAVGSVIGAIYGGKGGAVLGAKGGEIAGKNDPFFGSGDWRGWNKGLLYGFPHYGSKREAKKHKTEEAWENRPHGFVPEAATTPFGHGDSESWKGGLEKWKSGLRKASPELRSLDYIQKNKDKAKSLFKNSLLPGSDSYLCTEAHKQVGLSPDQIVSLDILRDWVKDNRAKSFAYYVAEGPALVERMKRTENGKAKDVFGDVKEKMIIPVINRVKRRMMAEAFKAYSAYTLMLFEKYHKSAAVKLRELLELEHA